MTITIFSFFFFFFQAEDGIRDTSVTGVQTCALPICSFMIVSIDISTIFQNIGVIEIIFSNKILRFFLYQNKYSLSVFITEIGRASCGKECRSRWSTYD